MRTFLKRKKLLTILAVIAAVWMWRLAGDVSQRVAEMEAIPDPILRATQLDKRRAGPDRTKRPGLEQDVIEIYESELVKHTLDDPPTDVPPIVLKLPEKFRILTSKGAVRDWGASLMTYYPSFTSPRDPENANYGLNCVGYCNGRIHVSIENVGRNAPSPTNPKGHFHTDYIVRNILSMKNDWAIETAWPRLAISNTLYTDFPPGAGFDMVFEELNTADDDARNIRPGYYKHVNRYYIHKNKEPNYYDFLVECQVPSGDNQAFFCEFHFSLLCNSAVFVKASIVKGEHMLDFFAIKSTVDRFVSDMIVKPECKRERNG